MNDEIRGNVSSGKTSWIYYLNKDELRDICEHYNIATKSSAGIDDFRKVLAEFVKGKAEKTKEEGEPKNQNSTTLGSAEESVVIMSPNIGKLAEFEPDRQAWDDYIEQLEFYLEANGITTDSKKRATLLTAIGAKNYAIIKSVCSPTAPKDVPYNEILGKCKNHFGKSINELLARVQFHKRDQQENESLKDFVREIRGLALDCKFTGPDGKLPLNIMLRDRFVAGIRNEDLQRYLCRRHEEATSETNADGLTFDKAVEIACSSESAEQQQKLLKRTETEDVQNITHNNKTLNRTKTRKPTRDPCYRCGYSNHTQDKCLYKNEKCRFCEKIGHLSRVCRKKQKSTEEREPTTEKTSKTHRIVERSCDESDESDDDIHAHAVQSMQIKKSSNNDYVVNVKINSHSCKFQVDNGAHLSLMNKQTFEKIWENAQPKWHENRVKLFGYGKKPIEVIGVTDVVVEHKQKQKSLPIVVTNETRGPNLLGRNWFEHLGIAVTGIHNVSEDSENSKSILKEFPRLTSKKLEGHIGTPIHIELKETAHPKFMKARRIPYGLQEAAADALRSMVEQKMLTPVNQSDWATPVLFVRKPNGKIRVVGDYKITVNPEIRDSEYPLPTVEEALATLNGGKFFAQVDLRDAYKQLQVDEETSKILTISTPAGLYNVNRLLDGIAAAPRIFQRFMATILSGIPGIQIYLDNVKIQGATQEEHDERVTKVLERLRDSNLRVNVEKSVFSVKSMKFLGHRISTEGIQPLENKTTAIKEMRAPTNKRELQVFLGGINFYARFIKDRAIVAEPLHRLLDTDAQWNWGEKEQIAFEKLKKRLVGSSILVHFDDKLPIVVSADAAPIGIGAVLAHQLPDQTEKPIAFFSKTLNKTQRQYAQLDREALALEQAVTHFHYFLSGRSFDLITDHQPLLGIFEPKKRNLEQVSPKLKRYKITLSAYYYKLIYRPAKKHGNADFLSRFPLEEETEDEEKCGDVLMLEGVTRNPISAKEIATETDNDNTLKLVKQWLNTSWPEKIEKKYQAFSLKRDELSIENGCLLWGSRVVIPGKLQPEIIKYLHANHPGIVTTKAFARTYAWWPGIDGQLETTIKNCDRCQETRHKPPRAPIHNWESPGEPWIRIHLDFAGPYQGQTFLIVVDAYSKWTEVCRVPSTSSTNVIRELRRLFASFGVPEMIVSDNDTSFKSEEMQQFYKRNGIEPIFTAPYHPASNGQAERAVQSTKQSLKILKDGDWETKISRFLIKQHTAPSTTTGVSPAELMMKRKLRTPLNGLSPKNKRRPDTTTDTPKGARKLNVGDQVRMLTHKKNGPKWSRATVRRKIGPLSYEVQENLTKIVHKRHIDHLRYVPKTQTAEERNTSECSTTTTQKINNKNQKHNYNLRKRRN